jgi:hypothetical protein
MKKLIWKYSKNQCNERQNNGEGQWKVVIIIITNNNG